MTVRTRVAPSPTGDSHVGTAYIALFNYCFAKAHGGEFVLRIEDTDKARSTTESEQIILDSLNWLGLEWSEGPDIGGKHGPYRQSERMGIYEKYARQLVEQGDAFICYRTTEELNELRKARKAAGVNTALKPADLKLSEQEYNKRETAGEPYVIRMMVPEGDGCCEINDMLRGVMELDWAPVDAQILLKSDGMPTYHLANVVDDHLMEISHVIRGEEWINSAPKHKLLYQYFDWKMPMLCHLPLLRNPDKSKLSKRKNPTSILYYQRMGYLPEALLNYLGRMGWSMPDGREKFTLGDMLDNFDIERVSLGGPIFDVEKLSWLNGLWIRENLDNDELVERLIAWGFNSDTLHSVLPHVRARMETFSDFAPLVSFLLSGILPITEASFDGVKGEREDVVKGLQFVLWKMEALRHWNRDKIFTELKGLADALDMKVKDFLVPMFIAISGSSSSFSVVDSMELLGPDMSRARIRHAIDVLGGVSKKGMKKLEKAYEQLP